MDTFQGNGSNPISGNTSSLYDNDQAPTINIKNILIERRAMVLPCLILDKIGNVLFKERFTKNRRAFLVSVILSIIEILILIIATLPEGILSPSLIFAEIFGSITTALVLYALSWGYEYIIEKLGSLFDDITPPNTKIEIGSQIIKLTDLKKQIIISLVVSACSIGFLAYSQNMQIQPFPIYISSYISLSLAAFFLAGGAYWAFVISRIPSLLKRMSSNDLKINRYNPSQTPILKTLLNIVTQFTIVCVSINTLCVITILFLQPAIDKGTTFFIIIIIFGGYLVTLFTFLYPRSQLFKIIRNEKEISIQTLYSKLDEHWIPSGENNSFEKIENLRKLINTIESTRSNDIDFSSIRTLVSMLVPILTYLISISNSLSAQFTILKGLLGNK